MDGTYGKLVLRSFSLFISADFSSYSFLKNAWGRFVYEKNQGAECHGNDRIKLLQMLLIKYLKISKESWLQPCFDKCQYTGRVIMKRSFNLDLYHVCDAEVYSSNYS